MTKMKKITGGLLIIAAAPMLSSCIQKEPLNTECDIVAATLPQNELKDIAINNTSVIMTVNNYVNITQLAPEFELTPGATIEPASGTMRDFSQPQTYTVTSQDREWHKNYTVSARFDTQISLNFSFENVKLIKTYAGGHYDEFYDVSINELTQQADTMFWASGNSGFAMTNGSKGPATYPTYQSEDGHNGKCVTMVTRSTGDWGAMVKKPLAAGNLFIGNFNTSIAVQHPLLATEFGTPFFSSPLYVSGYYQYTPGATYQKPDANGKLVDVPGKTDQCNFYAVFYERTDDMKTLNGENVLSESNPNILAVAQFSDEQRAATNGWVKFNLPFIYREGKKVDETKLANGGYGITIVMSSSIDGDFFAGAVGSTLLVDEVEISCN